VQIGGTSEAGATISVVVNGHTQTTTVAADGSWHVTFPTTEVSTGQYTTPVTVTATDAAGNATTISDDLVVDTVVEPFTHTLTDTSSHVADSVLNAEEAAEGLKVGGAVEEGSTVMVKLGDGSYHAATVTGGSWSYTFASTEITSGDMHSMTITAIATDRYGNVSSTITSPVSVDTEVVNFAHTSTDTSALVADTVLNGGEAAQGLTIGGTVEGGSSVMVKLGNGSYHAATVTNGTWTYTFASTEVTQGDLHTMQITAVATDAYGNVSSTITSPVSVDTEVSNFAHTMTNTSALKADAVLNGGEAAQGLTIGGTVEAGSTVMVKLGDGSYHAATVTNGSWTYTFASTEVTQGDLHSMQITAVATDAYGNVSAPISSPVLVDTLVSNFAHTHSDTSSNLADAILNKVEAQSGLTVGGTVEAGSTVMVKLDNGSYHAATVTNGSWSYTFAPGEISAGDMHSVKLTAVATDAYGNVSAPITSNVLVDTLVSNLQSTTPMLAGDGILNANEAAAGMVVSGTAEVGAKIVVHMQNGSEMVTTSDANGNWSVVFDQAHLPSGAAGTSSLTVTATDIAGNVAHYDQQFSYDTVAPDDPWITNDVGAGNIMSGIATAHSTDVLSYHVVSESDGAHELAVSGRFSSPIDVDGTKVNSDFAFFTNPVADGSYLVISDTDAAGNESSTLYIRSTTGEVTVDLSRTGLTDFDFGTIDLTASHASLTLTEAQIKNLTGADKSMTIAGAADDTVTLVGATDTHTTQTIHGETYHLYTLGTDGAQVLIDSDIIVNHTGV
jgi:large repetitive protein